MKKAELKNLMDIHGVTEFDYESVCDFVSDFLEMMADETNETEPYAVNTIKDYRKASYLVFALVNDIQEILEGDDE